MAHRDDDLAYGEYHGQGPPEEEESDRGFLGDTYRRFTGRTNQPQQGQSVSILPLSTPRCGAAYQIFEFENTKNKN
jgi:hypothetical protein